MIFDVLILIYVEKNKKRNVRNKFKTFIMRINQRFSKFFFEFLMLFSQLSHYSKQNLIDEFREKLIFQLQRVIVSNDRFETVESLKKLIEEMNQKLHFFEVTRFENSTFKSISRIIFKTSTVKAVARDNMFNVKKIMFVVDQMIMKTFYDRNDIDKNCYRCENFNHLIRDCSLSKIIDIWLSKKIKQKKNILTINEMNEFLMNFQIEIDSTFSDDYFSDTSSEIFSIHESKNV